MESSTQTGSPVRQRMIEDMRMRKLMPRTRKAYIRAVRKFTKILGRSPDALSA
jgi:integrase/recombinase XerD